MYSWSFFDQIFRCACGLEGLIATILRTWECIVYFLINWMTILRGSVP
uniref:Uncharacterized protein n=1 Tax=Anguilla anguilla TaxID=7936 RepID=A0A0E9X0X5_ANGAN